MKLDQVLTTRYVDPRFPVSARLVRCIAYVRLARDPVHLPALAAVVGVGLFEVRSVGVGPKRSGRR
jgi:hypothetical protein